MYDALGALRASGAALRRHLVTVRLPHDMPLLRFDAVLVERVLCNLLENAAKCTPPGSRIEIGAALRGSMAEVTVRVPVARTPRRLMQVCSASTTTPTPRGLRWVSRCSATCLVSRSWVCARAA